MKHQEDRVIWRKELTATCHVTGNTIRRWLLNGKLPEPDVNLSNRSKGWKISTLKKAGVNIIS